jgi:hypothetical protein
MKDVMRSECEPSLLERVAQLEMDELRANKGRLGAFKLESGDGAYKEYVGLAPKMYSLEKVERCGSVTEESKGKGVPKHYLKKNVHHQQYREMLFNPTTTSSEGSFARFQSFGHNICQVRMHRKILTALQDKTYQLDATTSRPLGQWRNRIVEAADDVHVEDEDEFVDDVVDDDDDEL